MMKKIIAVLVIFVCVGTALSAQISFSAGGGALLDMSFGNGFKWKKDKDSWTLGARNISFGAYGFFDATYAEASVSFAYGSLTGTYKENIDGKKDSENDPAGSVTQLGITLLGKYPISMGSITVFPLAGIGYNIVLSYKDDNGNNPYKDSDDHSAMKDMSQFAILAGGGLDFDITSNLFLRGSVLLQLRFPNKEARDSDILKDKDTKTTLGFGPVIKVAVGFRF
jgi:opacity protein-like surface antigen